MASKTDFSEQEKLFFAELGRDLTNVINKMLAKKAKAWKEISTKFNPKNPNGIKLDLSLLQG